MLQQPETQVSLIDQALEVARNGGLPGLVVWYSRLSQTDREGFAIEKGFDRQAFSSLLFQAMTRHAAGQIVCDPTGEAVNYARYLLGAVR